MDSARALSDSVSVKAGCVLTIGNFDGVHLGHREILARAKGIAEARQAELVVLTFEPHPVAVLYPDRAPGVLTPLIFKRRLLHPYAEDRILVLEDNRELLSLSPRAFVADFLAERIRPSVIVEGDDFNFGANRVGNIATLTALGQDHGFEVVVVDAKYIHLSTGQRIRVSSTMIRYMVESGHVSEAALALGRPYRLTGQIVSGRGKGRELGYPTLNMHKPKQIIPAEGVYAGYVRLPGSTEELPGEGDALAAVFSIGQAATFGDQFPLSIEAHVLDRQLTDVAAAFMTLDFVTHLRSQHKFPSPEDLVRQIELDCREARRALSGEPDRSLEIGP